MSYQRLLVAALLCALPLRAANSAEIKVLTAGAMKAVVLELVPAFEAATGHKVLVDNATVGMVSRRIAGGEAIDVAVATPAAIDGLVQSQHLAPGSRKDIAKVGMGVAVKAGAAKPDISSVDTFKATLLTAKSIAYIDPKAGGSSGIYFDKLIERLGIADAIRAKAQLSQGGFVAELAANGTVEIAIHQISEIVPVSGATLVGPLPAEIQNVTIYAAGLGTGSRETAAAQAFLAHLLSDRATATLATKGMERP